MRLDIAEDHPGHVSIEKPCKIVAVGRRHGASGKMAVFE
jgi:hypothetical protein